MDDEFKDLQRLLSLKRHETPPPDRFEDFLWEFQRRQRAEMLKRPLWRLALDRFEGARPNFSFARAAYQGAGATAVAVAVLVSGRAMVGPHSANTPTLVAQTGANRLSAQPVRLAESSLPKLPKFDVYTTRRSIRLPEMDFDQPRAAVMTYAKSTRPRYVLDTQPVSYEQPSSF